MKKIIIIAIIAVAVIVPLVAQMNISNAQPDNSDGSISYISIAEDTILSQTDTTNLRNGLQDTQFDPNDSLLDEQWAIESMNLPALWAVTTGSPEIIVAVLDTGIDKNHEDLAGQVIGEVNFTDSPTIDDIYGHGTHIAGIIAAKSDDFGVVGVAPDVRLLNVKVANDRGRCQVSDLAEGIIWAVDNGTNVINISIEIMESSPELEKAVNYAWNQGAVIVAAAGNDGSDNPVYPAFYTNCISVAALKEDSSLAPLSNQGDWVNLAAPGYKIYSTLPGNEYGLETGTSFAAAHVSGITALLFTIAVDNNNDGYLNDDVLELIEVSCRDIAVDSVGWGCVDASQIFTSG